VAVYVVGHSPRTGPVKIGYTDSLADRLRSLRRGETCPLAVHQRFSRSRPTQDLVSLYTFDQGDRDLERHLHFVFRDSRIDGEWFSLGTSPAEVVEKVTSAARVMSRQPALAMPIGGHVTHQAAEPGPEPLTRLAEDAARHHEMFRAWLDAGFNEDQAMKLLFAAIDREQSRG
jgi:hypothetical protein